MEIKLINWILIIIIIGLTISVVYLLLDKFSSAKKINSTEVKYNQLEGKINNIQLKSLESRLDPHLFKNILNSIQSHAYQTYFAMDKLANVLDYILYESRSNLVSPKEEIEFALNLIEIHKIKVSPLFELKVKTVINDFEPLFEQKLVAPLISIDLIENAFKHADLQNSDAFISVIFEFKDNIFTLSVSNKMSSKTPMKKEKSGFGMETLEKRLQLIYSENYKLDRFSEDDVYVAQLKINLLEYKTKMHTAG